MSKEIFKGIKKNLLTYCKVGSNMFKPGFHMSGKSQTIGDFAVSRLSQILPTNENSKS